MSSFTNLNSATGPHLQNNSSQPSNKPPSTSTSTCVSRHQLNNPSALITLTANNNSNHQSPSSSLHNNNETLHRSNNSIRGGQDSPVKNYSRDQLVRVTSKPPLPSTVNLNRPPSRYNALSQRKSTQALTSSSWATSMTPRMRIPVSQESYPPVSNGRPPSPLTRSGFPPVPFGVSRSQEIAMPPTSHHSNTSYFGGGRATSSGSTSKFKYNGPHQIYGGPLSEGPEAFRWPMTQSQEHLTLEPPPPPPGILRDIQFQKQTPSNVDMTASALATSVLNSAEKEPEFLMNILQAVRQADSTTTPFESHQGSLLLTSNGTGTQSPISAFPSSNTLAQMEQASLRSGPTLGPGPFENNGIPNDIQDDLLKIEMLLEFRKYKEALNKNIHNQNQIIQFVNSRGQLNSQQQQQQSQQAPLQHYPSQQPHHFPHSPPHHLHPFQQQHQPEPLHNHWHTTLSTLMDTPQQPSNISSTGGVGVVGGITPDLIEGKPIWSDEIANPFNAPDFHLNTFMEPHMLTTTASGQQRQQELQQRLSNISDGNANDRTSISTLQARNFEEYQALAEQSRSGFPLGMHKQNPLLAGAQLYSTPAPSPKSTADVIRPTPLRIQVAPREHSSQQQLQQQQLAQSQGQGQSIVQQKYQKFLLDRNFQFSSPNSIKLLESVGKDANTLMMRKPVAVSLKSGSPGHTPDGSSTQNSAMATPRTDGSGGMDTPSPYFPGFSGSPIDMKIRTPEEIQSSYHQRNGNVTSNNHDPKITRSRGAANVNSLEGMEELSNLLSQLPVLTRKEKVEEFQSMKTVKPASPVTDAESETSMIPLVSSNGTLVSERRPDTADTKFSKFADTENDFRNVDPNKLNINELVSLGRKIYRILSQLSTTPKDNELNSSQHQVITTPMTLNVPSPNTPIFTNSNTPALSPLNGFGTPQLLVDFNTIPNPTFVTGPSPNVVSTKSSPKVLGRSRTPVRPPNLFRKILQPPPTRWSGGRNRSTATSNPPPTAAARLSSWVSPKHSTTHQEQQKRQSNRSQISRKSMSSLTTGGRGRQSDTKALMKLAPSPFQRIGTPAPSIVSAPVQLPETFGVQEKYSNNFTPKTMSKYKHRRQPTPYPYQTGGLGMDHSGTHMMNRNNNQNNGSTSATTPTRGRSLVGSGRNFIQENISKLKNMKKLPNSSVKPRKLPPISKKKYEHIPSTIPGSRSRSNSNTRDQPQNIYDRYRRSSSVPLTTAGATGYSPSRHYPNRSVSTPRPSTGMSVHVNSSRSSTQIIRPRSSTGRPMSQGILVNKSVGSGSRLKEAVPTATKTKISQMSTRTSKVKFGSLPSKSSIGNGDSIGGSNSKLALARKSRSKTKRVSNLKKNPPTNNRNSSVSSADTQQQSQRPSSKPKKTVQVKTNKEVKPKGQRKKVKKPVIGDAVSDLTDEDGVSNAKAPIFNSESEQRMIREMVKAEMNMMVERHVKNVLKGRNQNQQTSRSRSRDRKPDEPKMQVTPTFLQKQQDKHDYDEEVDEGGDTEGERVGHPNDPRNNDGYEEDDEDEGQRHRHYPLKNLPSDNDHDDTTGIESDNITPVYTPPKYYDESLFSLEKWINPDGNSLPGSGNTSAKETPVTTANSLYGHYGVVVSGGVRKAKAKMATKPQTVRFSLPNQQQQHPRSK